MSRSTGEQIQHAVQLMRNGDIVGARRACESVLTEIPEHDAALHILGICFIREGAPTKALLHLQAASRSSQNDINIWLNLAIAQRMSGDMIGAADSLKRAIQIAPNLAATHNNLAIVKREVGENEEALRCFFKAVELDPNKTEYLCNLASLLHNLERDGEALSHFRHALELSPDNPEIHANLGEVLSKIDHIEAIGHYRQALALQERSAKAHLGLAHLLGIIGEFDEAETHLRRAIEINPNKTGAYRQLVHIRPLTKDDSELAGKIEQVLKNEDLSDSALADLHFALGKYYDSRTEYDAAFSHYSNANLLIKKELKFDPHKLSARIDDLISTFTPEFFRNYASGIDSNRAIIICGLPRSGTTLTEQILASHPDVYGAGELPFWETQEKSLLKESSLKGKRWQECLLENEQEKVHAMAASYLSSLNELAPLACLHVTDKMPMNFLHLGLIHLALPKVKIIHCNRHPIDNALSIYFLRFVGQHPYAYDLDDLTFYVREHQRLMHHWRQAIPRENLFEIQYEETVSDFERTARSLVSFAGIPWDDRCLNFHVTDRPIRTASKWQVRQPIYDSSVERWKNYANHIGPLRALL